MGIGSSVTGPLMLKGVSEFGTAYAAIQAMFFFVVVFFCLFFSKASLLTVKVKNISPQRDMELFPTNLLSVCISHETLQHKGSYI